MKNIFLILAILVLPILGGCCNCKKETTDDVIIQPDRPDDRPVVNVPERGTIERERYDDSVKVAERARESFIPEVPKAPITVYWLEGKFFDDRDTLEGVRYAIIQASQANNYVFTEEQEPNKKAFRLRIESSMLPMSLEETIKNAIYNEGYAVKVNRRGENLLIITPE